MEISISAWEKSNMTPIFTARISMWILGLVRPYVQSLPSVISLACPHCGLSINARSADGTYGSTFEIFLHQQNSSPSKHVVVLTHDGRVSISCASLPYDGLRSDPDFGVNAGISYSHESSTSALPCGCDPKVHWRCDEHHPDGMAGIVRVSK